MPRNHPVSCSGCPLDKIGTGFADPDGPPTASILAVGEALGQDEAYQSSKPFTGAAGGMLSRLLQKAGIDRGTIRLANVVSCQPPGNWLDGSPWEYAAISHCRQYLDPCLVSPHVKVIVPFGAVALRAVLNLPRTKGTTMHNFHGAVTKDPYNHAWVVPNFHPSHLQRGAANLIDVARFNLERAKEIAEVGWQPDVPALVCDPHPDWYGNYVDQYIAAQHQHPDRIWLAIDCETPDKANAKDEGELSNEDQSYQILRDNFCWEHGRGVTVPHEGPWLTHTRRLLAHVGSHSDYPAIKLLWHEDYDARRYRAEGNPILGRIWDLMWAAKILQSDLPRGLGFWAPFYSKAGPWKHWYKTHPKEYAAMDGVQTWRIGQGVVRDLISSGMWPVFDRYVDQYYRQVLHPAELVGVNVDRTALDAFNQQCTVAARRLLHDMQGAIPAEWRPLTPKGGLVTPPAGAIAKARQGDELKRELHSLVSVIEEHEVKKEVWCCSACGAVDVVKRHRCPSTKGDNPASLALESRSVPRFFWREPFNPDSPQQLLEYAKRRGHTPGKAKKTKQESMDRDTLERLRRSTKDPLYTFEMEYRAVAKVRGTYVQGTYKRIGTDGRLHPTPTFVPSTGRKSYVNPNITNVITGRGGKKSLAAGYRRCIVAEPGCRLLEVDYSGIEAVDTGWWARDPNVVRLAKLGMHAFVCSHVVGKPASLEWSDEQLSGYLKEIKAEYEEVEYDQSKRCVHGVNYGLTVHGMVRNFPDTFPDIASAQKIYDIYAQVCPALFQWQEQLRRKAHRQGYLGGPGVHPYGRRHWFWGVLDYRPLTESQRLFREKKNKAALGKGLPEPLPYIHLHGRPFAIELGEDAKRAVAFKPQSTAAGTLDEAGLALFDPNEGSPNYIGDAFFGRTPLRAPVHDSLLLEVPNSQWDRVVRAVYEEMMRPVEELPLGADWCPADMQPRLGGQVAGLPGYYLTIGVGGKVGQNWFDMEKLSEASVMEGPRGVVEDSVFFPHEEYEEIDDADLGTVVRIA